MHTMAVVINAGTSETGMTLLIAHYAVASTRKAVKLWLRKWPEAQTVAWRYHDGSGWADGSPDAWQHIDGIVGKKAEIVI